MGKATRAGGTEMSDSVSHAADQERSPEELRHGIERTREELGDTVEALAYKADVKAQAKERISSAKGAAQQKKDEIAAKVKSSAPESATAGALQVATRAKKNPVPLAAGAAFLAGVLVGRVSSR
jgi:hypothetical protein